ARAAAVARPLPREVDPLPQLGLHGRARRVRGQLHCARLLRPAACYRHLPGAVARLHGALLRVLPADAVLHALREDQAGADQGDQMRRKVASTIVAAVLVALTSLVAFGAGEGIELAPANTNIENTPSLQRGAKYFVNYCLGCHSAQYVRYNKLAEGLMLDEQQLIDNLIFSDQQPF